MNSTVEMWDAVNTGFLFAIAVLTFVNNRMASKNSKVIHQVRRTVNGPLSLALKSNAQLAQRVAILTGDRDDISAAQHAAALSTEQEEKDK